jgi:MFS family permease
MALSIDKEQQLYRKVSWRIIPILLTAYILAYLDRVNIGFAKLQMLNDLHFSETIYGLGAGMFFIGYFLFEVPSNLIMSRVGARRWMARIMVSWGIISGSMMLVSTPTMFYLLRFLLGLAEAGFFPGIIYYLSIWYPEARRGRIYALFMTGVAISGVIGGPLSGWILHSLSGVHNLAGWQWLFIIEAVPSIVMGGVLLFTLDDSIYAARWLNPSEKQRLLTNLQTDKRSKVTLKLKQVFTSPVIWKLSCIYFCFSIGLYGIGFWLPTIIKNAGVSDNLTIGVLSSIPYATAVVAMLLLGRSSDKHNERRWHLALAALAGSCCLWWSVAASDNLVVAIILLSLATGAILSVIPLFWSLPTTALSGVTMATAIAWINSLGNLSGFVGPYLIGFLKDFTGNMEDGIYFICLSLVVGAFLTLSFKPKVKN